MTKGPAYMTLPDYLEFVQEVWAGVREANLEKFEGLYHVEDLTVSFVAAIEAATVALDVLEFRLRKQAEA